MIRKLLLLCFCGCSWPLFAQSLLDTDPPAKVPKPFHQELALGGSAGITFSSIDFSPKIQQNMLMTYNMGFTARWISERHCGIQLELNYVQHGWDEQFEDPQWNYTRRINYLQIPFLSHFYVGDRRVRAIFNLGPQIGYALSESTSHNLESLSARLEPNTTHVIEREMAIENKFSWGLTGGLGMEVRTGIGHFMVEGRYFFSLGDIYKNRKEDYFAKSAPQVITVKLSYLIPVWNKK